MHRLACLAAAALALLIAAPAAEAGQPVKRCGQIGFTPQTEDGVFKIRARGTTCRRARRVARRARLTGAATGPFTYRRAGFRCQGRPVEDALPSARWRCRRGDDRVTFTRS